MDTRRITTSKTLDHHAYTIDDIRNPPTVWWVQYWVTNGAVLAFEQTIAHATNIPSANYEHLRGNGKEHYKEHTDHILAQIESGPGP
jgi:hypothetical protein